MVENWVLFELHQNLLNLLALLIYDPPFFFLLGSVFTFLSHIVNVHIVIVIGNNFAANTFTAKKQKVFHIYRYNERESFGIFHVLLLDIQEIKDNIIHKVCYLQWNGYLAKQIQKCLRLGMILSSARK